MSYVQSWSSDTMQGGTTFVLLQCRNGRAIQVGANSGFDAEEGHSGADLKAFVAEWRTKTQFSDPMAFFKALTRRGFQPRTMASTSDTQPETCLCDLYYPDVPRDWLVKSAEQKRLRREPGGRISPR